MKKYRKSEKVVNSYKSLPNTLQQANTYDISIQNVHKSNMVPLVRNFQPLVYQIEHFS